VYSQPDDTCFLVSVLFLSENRMGFGEVWMSGKGVTEAVAGKPGRSTQRSQEKEVWSQRMERSFGKGSQKVG